MLPTFEGGQPRTGRSIYSVEAKSNPKQASLIEATFALIMDDYKLIHYVGYDGFEDQYELFSLKEDPEELNNLYNSNKSDASELKNLLAEKVREVNQPYQH